MSSNRKFVIIIFLIFLLGLHGGCQIQPSWEVPIERYSMRGIPAQSDIQTLIFITPEIGFTCGLFVTDLKKDATVIYRTDNGGYDWQPMQQLQGDCLSLQYCQKNLYAFIQHKPTLGVDSSTIWRSINLGETWEKVISFDRRMIYFFVFDTQTMAIIQRADFDNNEDKDKLLLSYDGGQTWQESFIPGKINVSAGVFAAKNYIYLLVSNAGSLNFCSVDVYTGLTMESAIKWVDFMVGAANIMATNRGKVKFYQIKKNGQLGFLAKYGWGGWRDGSYIPKYVTQCGELVFGLINQYPGDKYSQALVFSGNGGKNWQTIHRFSNDESIYPEPFAQPSITSYEAENWVYLYYINRESEWMMNRICLPQSHACRQ